MSPDNAPEETWRVEKGGTLARGRAEAPTEKFPGVPGPATDRAGQYGCVTGVQHVGIAALHRFTLTHGFLEQ